VRASIESIFQELCAEPIREAVLANQRNVIIDIQTSYYREPEPIPQEYWWKAGVRCKAIVKYLSVYLRQEGFTVQEREQYYTRTYRGARPGTGLHAVPLTILW
jgi:ribosomal protein S19E (S16A)